MVLNELPFRFAKCGFAARKPPTLTRVGFVLLLEVLP